MRKLIAFLLAVLLVFCISGCKNTDDIVSDYSTSTQDDTENTELVSSVPSSSSSEFESVEDVSSAVSSETSTSSKTTVTSTVTETSKPAQSSSAVATSSKESQSSSSKAPVLTSSKTTVTSKPAQSSSAVVTSSKAAQSSSSKSPVSTSSETEVTSKPAQSSTKVETNNTSLISSTATHTHTHSYSSATCTNPAICSCGITSGKAIGHNFNKDVCISCGAANPDFKCDSYINGVRFNIGDKVEINVILNTNDTIIDVCPCFFITSDKDILDSDFNFYDEIELFALNEEDNNYFYPTLYASKASSHDEEPRLFSHWAWLTSEKTNPNATNKTFKSGDVIRRISITIKRPVNYTITIKDGYREEQNNYKYNNSLSLKINKIG